MKVESLEVRPLTKEAFASFGEVIETEGAEMRLINNGTTERFHNLAHVEATGGAARVLVNIFRGQAFAPPIDIAMLERHPLGSQAFMPLERRPFLVVVAEDEGGRPGWPQAFLAQGHQGVNYRRNVWHHPLLALHASSEFLVVDRGGEGNNLEEFFFEGVVYRIEALNH
ncbi:ureidoglycolate hydrolase [Paramesorhizobium deserti]|uniref:Ureidoglycolate lyase n=1 Tax=Paramesorhizobium deserti TaxID=1494590 RepID=A0A135HYQ2_9HYPH|nr:ureidoglycolate lyase [Paramesorhizobium deserti]KXF78336.1 ureidoglycolate hydrolase [Paramesorhizobium deserti]